MAIAGLMTSEQLAGKKSLNARRKVFYQFPNGGLTLMGLTSMLDTESTDKSDFGWHEERALSFSYKTVQANSAGPFTNGGGAAGDGGTDLTAAGWTLAKGATFRVNLDDVTTVQERDVLQFRLIPGTSSSVKTFQAVVTAVWPAFNTVDVQLIEDATNVLNTTAANSLDVVMVSSAAAEGDRSKTGFQTWPLKVENYTQIFRHAFNFTRTALKQGLAFDKTGPYKTKAKANSLKHMKAMEYSAFFGVRSEQTGVTTMENEASVRRTTGGIQWFIKQWELGTVANGGAFNYRPSGADITASDWKTTDDKRYIDVNGSCSKDEFESIIERAFRNTSDASYEKVMICGSGIISAFNKFVDRESIRLIKQDKKEVYGLDVHTWESPHGTIHFTSHQLFNQNPIYRNSGFLLDLGNIIYTPLNDSDTELLKNRQNNDTDGRKDEWLTEMGFEIRFPESHIFIDRLTGITS